MGTALISNPPYNMKWNFPPFAQIQPRFADCELPPESNANYAFVLSALNMVDDKAVLLLPCSVLSTKQKQEYEIKTETDCKINYIDDFKHIKFGIVWYLCYHIYIIEEESTQKSVQDSVQDNGNSGGVFVGEYNSHLRWIWSKWHYQINQIAEISDIWKYKEQEGKK